MSTKPNDIPRKLSDGVNDEQLQLPATLDPVPVSRDGTVISPFRNDHVPRIDLFSLFLPAIERNANRKAVVELFGEGRSLTFRELLTWSEAIACQFHDCGLRKQRNDRIAICTPNCIEYVLVYLATQRIGITLVGINHMSTADELQYYLTLTGAAALVTAESLFNNAKKVASASASIRTLFVIGTHRGATSLIGTSKNGHFNVPHFPSNITERLPAVDALCIKPDTDVALIQFSSGTTGLPKAVCLSHYNFTAIQTGFEHESVHNSSSFRLVYQPLSHIYGLGITSETLGTGSTLLLQNKFNLHEYLMAVETHKIATLHIVPPIASMMSKTDLSRYDLSSVDTILVASAPLSSTVENQLKASIANKNIQIAQAFGMTETTGIITMTPSSLSADQLREKYNIAMRTPAGSCGLLYVNTEAKVIDLESGKVVGPNVDGEIFARGPQVMLRYLNNESATSETIDHDGWLRTGDIGHYDQYGYFFIVDRAKELIKYKGFQVPPAELESLILQHPDVYDVGVVGIVDEKADELPQAWVVRKPDASTLTEQEVLDWVSDRSAPYKWLRGGVRFVDVIPRSPTGKILRRFMRSIVMNAKL